MRRILIFFVLTVFLTVPSFSEEKAVGREFYGATVLLIDHDKGMLGVTVIDEITEEQQKVSFQVDPELVYVTDALNHPLDFSDIQQGDQVDIFTEMDAAGREVVVDITDRSRLERA